MTSLNEILARIQQITDANITPAGDIRARVDADDDEEFAATLREIRAVLPVGWSVECTGDCVTDADGHTVEDVWVSADGATVIRPCAHCGVPLMWDREDLERAQLRLQDGEHAAPACDDDCAVEAAPWTLEELEQLLGNME